MERGEAEKRRGKCDPQKFRKISKEYRVAATVVILLPEDEELERRKKIIVHRTMKIVTRKIYIAPEEEI